MLNTVEKRRQLLAIVVILFIMHAFLSGWLIKPEQMPAADIERDFAELITEYRLMWGNE